nr:ribonuclease H-like domain-containing protein [Tanacetum cinerariifolium]
MGHFSRECQAQGVQNSNNYQKYKYKEVGKDGSNSKVMVVVDGIIDWDKQTEGGNTEPRSLENFGMITGIKIESDADSEGEVVSADDVIPAGVFVPAGTVAAVIVSSQSETEFALMGLSTEAKWNNSGKNLYKLIDSSMSVRTKRGLGLDKYIRGRFASVDHIKAVPPPLTGNYMPPSNIPDIDESHMVYRKKATDSSEIKTTDDSITHTNDSVLFDLSDRSSEPSTNDLKMYDSSVECLRPNHSDHDSTSSVFAPASVSKDTIVIDCNKQENFPSVCSIETDVKSSKPLCNKFGSFNKESHLRKHKSVASKSCYVCGSYLHLIKDCDFHEQTFAKRNAEGNGILGRRPTGKPVHPNRPKPVSAGHQNSISAGQQNTVSAGQPNPVSARQQNTVFVHPPNPVYAGQPNPVFAGHQNTVFASPPNPVYAGQPNPVYAGDGILGPRPLNIQPTRKGTIKTKNLNFENVLYVEELQHFNILSVSQICDQAHRVLFTKNECLVLFKDFPLPNPSMVILSIPRKHNLYTFSLNELAPNGPLTCLIAKASQDESTVWHKRLGHVNFKNMNKLVKDSLLPTILWSEAVATACYVLHRVLVTKPHHKTPYELLTGDKPSISYLKPFGCHVTILNTSNPLGKFDKKSDEGYIVGYSISSKAYRVYNLVSRKIKETMNLNFLENKPFVAGTGQSWMFDIDYLTDSLNYSRVSSTNLIAGSQGATPSNAVSQEDDSDSDDEPDVLIIQSTPTSVVPIVDEATTQNDGKEEADRLGLEFPSLNPILGVGTASIGSFISAGSTPPVSAGSTPQLSLCASLISAYRHSSAASKSHVSAGRPTGSTGRLVFAGKPTDSACRPVFAGKPTGSAGRPVSAGRPTSFAGRLFVPAGRSSVPASRILGKVTASASSERFPRASSVENSYIHDGLKIFDCLKSSIFKFSSYDDDFSGPDANNLESSFDFSSTITKRIQKIHPTSQVIGDINSPV